MTEPPQDADTTQGDWEDEGGAPLPEPTQRTAEECLEIPVPKRTAVPKVFEKTDTPVSGRGTDSPTSEK